MSSLTSAPPSPILSLSLSIHSQAVYTLDFAVLLSQLVLFSRSSQGLLSWPQFARRVQKRSPLRRKALVYLCPTPLQLIVHLSETIISVLSHLLASPKSFSSQEFHFPPERGRCLRTCHPMPGTVPERTRAHPESSLS